MITAIRSTSGKTYFGQNNGDLGPANVYWSTGVKANLTGTIDATGTSVTGTSTLFTTELRQWDYIQVGSEFRKVLAITSDTALTLESAFTVDPSSATYKKFTTIWLGNTGEVELIDEEKYSPIKFIQKGDVDADNVCTGYDASIKVMLGETTQERLEKIFQHIRSQYTALGAQEGYYRTMALGTRHSDFWDELKIVKIVGGADSIDPFQTVTIPRCAPIGKLSAKYNSTDQRIIETTFKVYPDDTKLVDGSPVLWYSGTVTFDT
jgi:hypothetical protein